MKYIRVVQGEAMYLNMLNVSFGVSRLTDVAFGFEAAQTFRNNAEQFGVRIRSFQVVPFNIGHLDAQDKVRKSLLEIKTSGARVILCSTVVNDAGKVLKEARHLGMTGPNTIY